MNTPPSNRLLGQPCYDIREVDAGALTGYENALWDLFKRRYDGLIVRGALSGDDCAKIVAHARRLTPQQVMAFPEGWTYPARFTDMVESVAEVAPDQQRKAIESYFELCAHLGTHAHSAFGMDAAALIEEWLGRLGSGLAVGIPAGFGGRGKFAGATLRAFKGKGEGRVSLQCGNYFHTLYQRYFEHLEMEVDVYDQLGFFFLLQAPEQGGEVSLYPLEWEQGQHKATRHANEAVILPDGTPRYLPHEPHCRLAPQVGDLVLFAAGQIWHRLEEVQGNVERITLGGNIGYSYDKLKVYHWS